MKNKINIAELLKDCPQGMELNCTIFEGLEFDAIIDNEYLPIRCRIKNPNGGYTVYNFTKYGCWLDTTFAKCVIFPKGKTTWEGFQRPFRDGDILIGENGNIFIYKGPMYYNKMLAGFYCGYRISDGAFIPKLFDKHFGDISECRFASEEEKAKLFQVIKTSGYKWNPETKTLDKLPKFKVGDTITNGDITSVINQITKDSYILDIKNDEICFNYIFFKDQDKWQLVSDIKPKFKVGDRIKHKGSGLYCTLGEYSEGISAYRTNIGLSITPTDLEHWELIPDKPYFKVGDRIRHKKNNTIIKTIGHIYDDGYALYGGQSLFFKEQDEWELVPDKFDINTLVPFESKVLVRNDERQRWLPAFWGYKVVDGFITTFGWCKYCIPYKGNNKRLLGTTNDCNDFYKTWEE